MEQIMQYQMVIWGDNSLQLVDSVTTMAGAEGKER
jgi:hypothetical protein